MSLFSSGARNLNVYFQLPSQQHFLIHTHISSTLQILFIREIVSYVTQAGFHDFVKEAPGAGAST
jgi:hypothetical protein